MSKKTPDQPNPLQHAGLPSPRSSRANRKRRPSPGPTTEDAQQIRRVDHRWPKAVPSTATIDPEMVGLLARVGRWAKPKNRIRFAVWNCLRNTPELQTLTDGELWDRMGRWGSETRSLKEAPEISERHMALGHLQRLLYAMQNTSVDPQREKVMHTRVNRLLQLAVVSWEKALRSYLESHPELFLSHDEFAGFVSLENPTDEQHRGLMSTPRPVRDRRRADRAGASGPEPLPEQETPS